MKRLGLLRHAKSDWGDPSLDDFDRPLNARGRSAAARIGDEFGKLGIAYDLALVSPARRAAETFELVRERWAPLDVRAEPRLYGASVAELLAVIAEVPQAVERLLLVGHNPGLHQMAARFAGDGPGAAALAVKLPTGSLVEIALSADKWKEAPGANGELLRFLRPRDLD